MFFPRARGNPVQDHQGPVLCTLVCRGHHAWLGGLGQKCGLSGGSARGHG